MEMYVRPEQHETSTAARKMLAMAIPDGWEERLDVGGDYGVDDHIEIFRDGWTTGLLLMVQRKGFDEAAPGEGTTELVYDMPVRTLHYAELLANPVLLGLVPVRANSACFYYIWLQEYIRVRLDHENPTWRDNKDSVRVRVPTRNRMPGNEARLEHIAGAPRRDREWARAARLAHEMSYASESGDLERLGALVDDLYKMTSIFGDPNWPWSMWARSQVLDPMRAAVTALQHGNPVSNENLAAAGRDFIVSPGDGDEPESKRFVLESTVKLGAGQLTALISTSYDTALQRLVAEADGTWSY